MKCLALDDLRERESDILQQTNDKSPEIFWFHEFYKNLQKILFIVPEKREEDELDENPSRFFLLITTTFKIVHSSHSIMNLITRGYYHQGMILLRSIQEEYHHLLFFAYHPNNDIKQWREQRIKSKQINKFMKKSGYIPKKWKAKRGSTDSMLKMLSSYVHPSIDTWGSILDIKKDPLDINLKILPRYENNSFNTVFTGLMLYLDLTTKLLLELYETELKKARTWVEITESLYQFNLEYMDPILKLMSLDYGTKMIG